MLYQYIQKQKTSLVLVLYCIVVLIILALIVLNTTALIKLENIDTVNFYTTLIISFIFIVAIILQISRVFLKNKYKENILLKEDVLSLGFTIALCFLALRIVLNGDEHIYVVYTGVMAITLILFLTKEIIKMFFWRKYTGGNITALKILIYIVIFALSAVYTEQVLISFVGDVYCDNADNSETTREVLKLLNEYKVPVAVLSKGGSKMLKDLDVFKSFGDRITVGTTLTFLDKEKSKEWEPYASLPEDRLYTLKTLHENGIKTFASFEPTIEPDESIKLIERTLKDNSVEHYKIGKINNYKNADKWQDWEKYLFNCIELLRPAMKKVYYKFCLRKLAPNVILWDNEKNPDLYNVRTSRSEQSSIFDNI